MVQGVMVEKAWHQDPEAAGYRAATPRKLREMNASPQFAFLATAKIPVSRRASSLNNLVKILPHRRAQRPLPGDFRFCQVDN